ncbi:MAG: diaminopimelate decarboxylase [Alphaproteobacteria bacterium]|nr:diaminopimelate decarboxylase [Alphaproteobacteria bacterium]
MSAIGYKSGKLHIENVALEKIAETHGTPVYCYSAEQIADNFRAWQSALRKVMPDDKFTICYACKANSNLAVMKLLGGLGAGADVVSGGEMHRAFRAGIPGGKMVFSGVGKSEAELATAIKNGLMLINVESGSELRLISKIAQRENTRANISFRINPNVDAKTHAKITTGLRENKFGIDLEDAAAFYREAKAMPGILPTGVSIHIGSQLTDLAPFEEAFTHLAGLVAQLRQQGHAIATLDLGGGLGITYKDEVPPDLGQYAALIRDIILPLGVHVVLEPGRSIVGDAGILLTRVLHKKEGHTKKFLIVDAAMNDLMRPALYGAYHPVIPCNAPAAGQAQAVVDVVGPVCETSDTFLTDTALPENITAGDLLAIMVSGAYGAVMASNYNTRPLVPEVLVHDGKFDLVRKIQKIEDILNDDIVPGWLA